MYQDYYGLDSQPFENTPDPMFLFATQRHREALASLLYGISEAKGLMVLSGAIGTGKTTIVRALLKRLSERHIVIDIVNPKWRFDDVLGLIAGKLKVAIDGDNNPLAVDRLKERLLKLAKDDRRLVLIIDEAHLLSIDVLEDIRLLSNIETESGKLIQIVLVGQPEIHALLQNQQLRALQQRIVMNRTLEPLTRKETKDYISHRLHVVGAAKKIFKPRALGKIWKVTGGVPRLINQVCDNALLIGYAGDAGMIGPEIIKEVQKDMSAGAVIPNYRRNRYIFAGAIASCVISVLIFGLQRSYLLNKVVPMPTINNLVKEDNSIAVKKMQSYNDLAAESPDNYFRESYKKIGILNKSLQLANVASPQTNDKQRVESNSRTIGSIDEHYDEVRVQSSGDDLRIDPEKGTLLPNKPQLPNDIRQLQIEKSIEGRSSGAATHVTMQDSVQSSDEDLRNNFEKITFLKKPLQRTPMVKPEALLDTVEEYHEKIVKPNDFVLKILYHEYGLANQTLLDLVGMANPHIMNPNLIFPDQTIILPVINRKDLLEEDDNGFFYIHYASFFESSVARQCAEMLGVSGGGHQGFIFPAQQQGRTIYRVYYGIYVDETEALKHLENIDLKYLPFLNKG